MTPDSISAAFSAGEETAKRRPLLIRVATGTPGQNLGSGLWRIWQPKNTSKDDIYIAARSVAGQLKCSLHANRYSYIGFTKPFFDELTRTGRAGKKKEWISWERPPTPENGYVVAAEIMLPPGPLQDWEEPIPAPIWLIAPPPVGKGVLVSVIFARVPQGKFIVELSIRELGYSRLNSGEFVVVLASLVDFDYESFKSHNRPLVQANLGRMRFLPAEPDYLNQPLRMILVCEKKDDEPLRILDAAVTISRPTE